MMSLGNPAYFEELRKAMEDTERYSFDYFLERKTGRLIILSEDILSRAKAVLGEMLDEDIDSFDMVELDENPDIPDWMEEEVELAVEIFLNEGDKYERVPERSSEKCYEAMKRFAETLDNRELGASLLEILDGKGAFGRFREALLPYPKEKKMWHKTNASAVRQELLQWLKESSISFAQHTDASSEEY